MMRYLLPLLLLMGIAPCRSEIAAVWPEMQELEVSVDVLLGDESTLVEIPFSDLNGNIRYWLSCRAGTLPWGWSPLTCMMIATDMKPSLEFIRYKGVDILANDESKIISSRAQIAGADLVGACGDYPEYGRVRHFRQRGFELTLAFSDIVFSSNKEGSPKSVTMHVALRRDSGAQTAFAAMTGYRAPKGACETIIKSSEPYICYDQFSASFRACMPGSEYEPNFAERNPYALPRSVGQTEQGRRTAAKWVANPKAPGWPMNLVEERLSLIRKAARDRDGTILRPILPEPPFLLLCGKTGAPEWKGLRVDDMAAWNRLWLAMLSQEAFRGFEDLSMDEVQLSSKNGIWIRGETFRFQDGLTVATDLSCSMLEGALD